MLAAIKPVTGTGAFCGIIAGEVAIFVIAAFTNISYLWYNVIRLSGGRCGGRRSFLSGEEDQTVLPGYRVIPFWNWTSSRAVNLIKSRIAIAFKRPLFRVLRRTRWRALPAFRIALRFRAAVAHFLL